MILPSFHSIVLFIQSSISFLGTLIIFVGILQALYYFVLPFFSKKIQHSIPTINNIRMTLGRTMILGLEFIVAADLIGTTTTPDYYSLGILAGIVLIRTLLSFSLNRELIALKKEP